MRSRKKQIKEPPVVPVSERLAARNDGANCPYGHRDPFVMSWVVGEGPLVDLQIDLHEAIERGDRDVAHGLACELEHKLATAYKHAGWVGNAYQPFIESSISDWPPYTDPFPFSSR